MVKLFPWSVVGDGDRHVVLEGVSGFGGDAVVEDGEGEQVPVCGLAVADQVGYAR